MAAAARGISYQQRPINEALSVLSLTYRGRRRNENVAVGA